MTPKPKYRLLDTIAPGVRIVSFGDYHRVLVRREYHRAGYFHTRWRASTFEEAEKVMFHRHPCVAAVFEFGHDEDRDVAYTVQECVYGVSMETLALGRQLPLERVLCVAVAVCGALESLHAVTPCLGLAPHHVMMTVDGGVKIIGREEEFLEPSDPHSLNEPLRSRRLPYMSPDQLRSAALSGDPRSDIYALGVCMWTWLVGAHPHETEGRSQLDLLRHIDQCPVPGPRAWRPDIPAWLDTIIARAAAPDPADRFQSALEMKQAIAQQHPIRPTTE